MEQSPKLGRVVLDSIDPVLALFTARGVNLERTGVRKAGTSVYTNGNTLLAGCDAFVLTANQGSVSYPIKPGASITFYRKPGYSGREVLCLIEDFAGRRTFSVTGGHVCKIRDTRPAHQSVPLPPVGSLTF